MTSPRPMCLVLEPTELSVAKAERYGTVTYLFHSKRNHAGPSTSRFAVAVVDRARELGFDPARDYFVVTGQLLQMVSATAALVAHYGQLRGLHFNGHDTVRDYEAMILGEKVYVNALVTNESEGKS